MLAGKRADKDSQAHRRDHRGRKSRPSCARPRIRRSRIVGNMARQPGRGRRRRHADGGNSGSTRSGVRASHRRSEHFPAGRTRGRSESAQPTEAPLTATRWWRPLRLSRKYAHCEIIIRDAQRSQRSNEAVVMSADQSAETAVVNVSVLLPALAVTFQHPAVGNVSRDGWNPPE